MKASELIIGILKCVAETGKDFEVDLLNKDLDPSECRMEIKKIGIWNCADTPEQKFIGLEVE